MNDSSSCFLSNDTFSLETPWAEKVIPPLGVLVCLTGLVSNGLVLGLLGLSLKWGDFTVFVFHLSLADFLYLCCVTVWFMGMILDTFHGVRFAVRYMFILMYTSYTAGLCLLTAISVWRCLSVLHPIWCRLHAPRHAPAVLCSLTWVLSISVNVPQFLVCVVHRFSDWNACVLYRIICSVFFGALFTLTVICILIMLFKVRCGTRLRLPLKLLTTVLLTVLFALCAFPFGFRVYFYQYTDRYLQTLMLLILLSCVNSSANPLVYYFVGRFGGRRRGGNLREVFQKVLGEESALRRDTSSGAVNSSV